MTAGIGANGDVVEFSENGGTTIHGTDNSSPYQYTTTSITAGNSVTVSVRSKNTSTGCTSAWTNSAVASANLIPGDATIAANFRCGTGTVLMTAGTGANGDVVEFSENGGTTIHGTDNSSPYQYTTTSITTGNTVTVSVRTKNSVTGCTSAWTNSAVASAYALPTIAVTTPATCNPDLLTWSVGVTVSSGTVTSTSGTVTNTFGNIWSVTGISNGTIITLTVTDDNGCINTLPVTAPYCACPTIAHGTDFNPTTCNGTNGSMSFTGLAVNTLYTVNYKKNGVAASPATRVSDGSGILSLVNLGAGSYTAINVSVDGGCSTNTLAGPFVLSNPPLPTPYFIVKPGPQVCIGSVFTYTTQSGMSNYVWNISGIADTDYSIISGGTGTTSNTVSLTWMTEGSKAVSINYINENG
jgi:hypothetical protein